MPGIRLVFKKDKDTKTYGKYFIAEGSEIQTCVYFPKGLPDTLTFEQVSNSEEAKP